MGDYLLDRKCTTNWLLFPLLKKSDREKENEFAKPVLDEFFNDPFNNHL